MNKTLALLCWLKRAELQTKAELLADQIDKYSSSRDSEVLEVVEEAEKELRELNAMILVLR